MVERLVKLGAQRAWRGQVAHMIGELEADQSGYWKGIRQAVNDAEAAAKAGQAKAPGSEPLQPVRSP
jgi:hypothetical protein